MSSTALINPKAASTPVKKTAAVTESPGNWKHPRLAEITKRQNATVFSESNVKTIVYNVIALAVILVARLAGTKYLWLSKLIIENARIRYPGWIWFILQLIPVINVGVALLPLFRKKDDMSDIPLTPGQRKLLGLPASSTPATPGSKFSTPPRYSRTPSISGSVGSNKSYASSPLSGKGSPAALGGRINGSPYSPAGSPLLQKAVTGGVLGARRSSFGSASPQALASGASLFGDAQGTPSPTSKRSSVGLNSKWLYDKGRRGSGGSWMH